MTGCPGARNSSANPINGVATADIANPQMKLGLILCRSIVVFKMASRCHSTTKNFKGRAVCGKHAAAFPAALTPPRPPGRRFLAWIHRVFPQPNLGQWLALLNGCRHDRAQLNQKSFSVFWIFDPLGGELLRRLDAQEGRFQFGMLSNGLASFQVRCERWQREPLSIGIELGLLDHPLIAARMLLLLTDDSAFGVATTFHDRDAFTFDGSCGDLIADLGLGLRLLHCTLQILAPENSLPVDGDHAEKIRGALRLPELIVGGTMLDETPDGELALSDSTHGFLVHGRRRHRFSGQAPGLAAERAAPPAAPFVPSVARGSGGHRGRHRRLAPYARCRRSVAGPRGRGSLSRPVPTREF